MIINSEVRRFLERRQQSAINGIPASGKAMQEIGDYLENCGYSQTVNPELFNALCTLGGSELEHSSKCGLFLKGGVGIGKSLGLQILSKAFDWKYLQAVEIQGFYSRRPAYEDWENYCRGMDFHHRPQTMVIDDLGTELFPYVLYGATVNPLQELLEIRYRLSFHQDNVRTVVICNLTDDEIRRRYGFRIMDRIKEMFYVVTIKNGTSQRGKKPFPVAPCILEARKPPEPPATPEEFQKFKETLARLFA